MLSTMILNLVCIHWFWETTDPVISSIITLKICWEKYCGNNILCHSKYSFHFHVHATWANPLKIYILFNGLFYNMGRYFASCVVFFWEGVGKYEHCVKCLCILYIKCLLNHQIWDLLFQSYVMFWYFGLKFLKYVLHNPKSILRSPKFEENIIQVSKLMFCTFSWPNMVKWWSNNSIY